MQTGVQYITFYPIFILYVACYYFKDIFVLDYNCSYNKKGCVRK